MPYGNGANWSGVSWISGQVTREMEYTGSPTEIRDVQFKIGMLATGGNVASALARAWNDEYKRPTAQADGPVVRWCDCVKVTRMSVKVKGTTKDLPADHRSVGVVYGLNVNNTDGEESGTVQQG